jgi:hypothetical protein
MRPWLIGKAEYVVVVFDMISSSEIFENLLQSGNETKFLELWDEIRQLLYERRKADMPYGHITLPRIDFVPVKFTGDGWLLLFPLETKPLSIIQFLHHVSLRFTMRFRSRVEPYLAFQPRIGLRFGMDCGVTLQFKMFGSPEYIGSPIIEATRLQEALRSFNSDHGDGLLISEGCFRKIFQSLLGLDRYELTQTRVNIRDRGKDCFHLTLPK